MSDETWSGVDPTCVAIKCPIDKLYIENGRFIGNVFLFAVVIFIKIIAEYIKIISE